MEEQFDMMTKHLMMFRIESVVCVDARIAARRCEACGTAAPMPTSGR